MSRSSLSGSVDVVNADHDRWSSSSVGVVVEFSSWLVGSFSHRRVSEGDGLSCVVKCDGCECVLEHEGDLHVPYPTAVCDGSGVVRCLVVEVCFSEGCVDDDDGESDAFLNDVLNDGSGRVASTPCSLPSPYSKKFA